MPVPLQLRRGASKIATSDTYKPKAADVGGTLTATARYFDGHSAAQTPTATEEDCYVRTSANTVVLRDTRNKAPVFGDEDPDTRWCAEQRGDQEGGGEDHGQRG